MLKNKLYIASVFGILLSLIGVAAFAATVELDYSGGTLTITYPDDYESCNPEDLIEISGIVQDRPITLFFSQVDRETGWMIGLGSHTFVEDGSVSFPYPPTIEGEEIFSFSVRDDYIGQQLKGYKWSVTCEEPPVCEFDGETAWAANGDIPLQFPYTNRGNWATYVAYAAKTTTLFAGQTIPVGSVTFSEVDDGYVNITVSLTAPWVFEGVSENLKVQDYAEAPSGNPEPGLFAHKVTCDTETNNCSISVPANNFYGVHVNVGQWMGEDCE